jgi:hypothetical protein
MRWYVVHAYSRFEQQVRRSLIERVSRMGMKVDDASATDSDELDLAELSIGDGLRATIAFVRIPRDELPPKEDMVAQALRSL